MPEIKIALDRSMRTIDADGRLHIGKSHISKAKVSPYYGKEIPGFDSLGLDPNKIYKLLRDPVELERGAETFARLPILKEHAEGAVTVDSPNTDLVVGAIGSDVSFNAPYLDADLCFWDATAIAGIDSDKVKELSCGYRYVPVMEAGEFEGQEFDGRMTEIKGNHLALVEVGRAGSDVVVADSNPFTFKERTMKMTKLGKALFAALCMTSTVLAADAALPELVGGATRKDFKKDELKAKLIAKDASLDSNKLDSVLDAILDVQEDPKPVETEAAAVDESPSDKVRKMLAGKVDDATLEEICKLMSAPASDATPMEEDNSKVEAAMDSLRKEFRDADEARRDVRPTVGDVIGLDSAEAIYGFALDHMKVDHEGVEGVKALRALYKAANKAKPVETVVAQDASGLAKMFPAATRFRNA